MVDAGQAAAATVIPHLGGQIVGSDYVTELGVG